MKRTIIGPLIFFITLLAGIHTAAFVATIAVQFSLPADMPEPSPNLQSTASANTPTGVHVSYIGMTELTMRFLVYNGSTRTLSCVGYSGICAYPALRINELDARAWVCMRGASHYEIKPGDTVELMVSAEDFAFVPDKDDPVSVGFEPVGSETQQPYFARSISLPRRFIEEIRELWSKRHN